MDKKEWMRILEDAKSVPNEKREEWLKERLSARKDDADWLLKSVDTMAERIAEISEQVKEFAPEAEWLSMPWVNTSEVCRMLYGNKENSTVAYFTLKRQGKRPWKREELDKLAEIKQQLANYLMQA